MNDLILESNEWWTIDEDDALIIMREDTPIRKYPKNLYYFDQTEEFPSPKLIFDFDNGAWEEYPLESDWEMDIDDDGNLAIFDSQGEILDILEVGDFYIEQDTGRVLIFDDSDFYILEEENDDEFGLFSELPYQDSDGDGWKR